MPVAKPTVVLEYVSFHMSAFRLESFVVVRFALRVRLLYISHSLFAGKRTSHPTVAICIFPEGVVELHAITDLG
jgi:hypothetical protein